MFVYVSMIIVFVINKIKFKMSISSLRDYMCTFANIHYVIDKVIYYVIHW